MGHWGEITPDPKFETGRGLPAEAYILIILWAKFIATGRSQRRSGILPNGEVIKGILEKNIEKRSGLIAIHYSNLHNLPKNILVGWWRLLSS